MDGLTSFGKSRAVLTGAVVGTTLAGAPILAVLAYDAARTEGYREIGLTAVMVVGTAMPMTIVLGALVGVPTAALLVWTMTSGARRWPLLDRAVSWAVAGSLLCVPLAWAVSEFNSPGNSFQVSWLTLTPLMIGALSALAAWRVRPSRSVAPPRERTDARV